MWCSASVSTQPATVQYIYTYNVILYIYVYIYMYIYIYVYIYIYIYIYDLVFVDMSSGIGNYAGYITPYECAPIN